MKKAFTTICHVSVFGIVIVFIVILLFFFLYKLKSELGIDFFPEIHLQNILDSILNDSRGGS